MTLIHQTTTIFCCQCSKVFKADLQILAAACLFGLSFIIQREVSLEGLDSITCNAIRFGLSVLLIAICMPFLSKQPESHIAEKPQPSSHNISHTTSPHNHHRKAITNSQLPDIEEQCVTSIVENIATDMSDICSTNTPIKSWKHSVINWGILLGLCNLFASNLQQYALFFTTANKVAFINGLDIFFTPLFMLIFFKKSISSVTWFSIFVSLIGLCLLSHPTVEETVVKSINSETSTLENNNNFNVLVITEEFLEFFQSFSGDFGEFLVLISTFFWAGHLIVTDLAFQYFPDSSSTSLYFLCQMMGIQYVVVTIGSFITAIMLEHSSDVVAFLLVFQDKVVQFFWPMLLLSAMETVGMLLLAKGQNYAPPAHAAILLCLEGVFTTIGSFIFLPNESLHIYEWIGCVLILVGVMVATYYDEVVDNKEE